jgi:hypothetical protein
MADTTTSAKKPRASRAKKTDAAPAPSILSAMGSPAVPAPAETIVSGGANPAIFVDEIEHIPPTPAPAIKKSGGGKKPAVVAVVTPDGIQGSLSSFEQRPLIAHLPIHTSDIYNEMFGGSSSGQTEEAPTPQPKPFDPSDSYVAFSNSDEKPTAPPPAPVAARPSLPLHHSERLMVRFQDANREQRLPENTDVACYWDCHPFRGSPYVIPTVIEEGVWRVYGNFCCPECAAAYLFNERMDSHVKWERYALLNRLYASGADPVHLAPPPTVLRLFGGPMDIVDYRSTVAEKRIRVDVMTPPMISIIQVMDTKPIDFYDASIKNNFIPWEMDRMNRPGAQGLRLRRTKPIAEKEATLEYIMGITT